MQRPTDAKIGLSFYTSLYTDIKIHSSWEVCFAQRYALQVAIVCFEYTSINCEKRETCQKLAPENNFIRVYCQEEIV